MVRGPNESVDLDLVKRLVFDPAGVLCQRFDRRETLLGKTPDFKLFQNDSLFGYCEVKSPRDDWLDEQFESATSNQLVGGGRPDPVFNRILRHLESASSQLQSANPTHIHFNCVIFVNHDNESGYVDLQELLTGFFQSGDDSKHRILDEFLSKRAVVACTEIELVGWIDAKTSTLRGWVKNQNIVERSDAMIAALKLGVTTGPEQAREVSND